MFDINEIAQSFESFAPKTNAFDWDNTGVLIDCQNKGNNILLTIDLTDEVVDEILSRNKESGVLSRNKESGVLSRNKESGVLSRNKESLLNNNNDEESVDNMNKSIDMDKPIDFIICYHPVIFTGIKKITDSRYINLIKRNISVFCPHTQLDVLMNEYLRKEYSNYTLMDSIKHLKSRLGLKHIRVIFGCDFHNDNSRNSNNDNNDNSSNKIMGSRLYVGVGSAYKTTDGIKDSFFITGEISHHSSIEFKRNNNCVIILEHSNSERLFLPELKNILDESFIRFLNKDRLQLFSTSTSKSLVSDETVQISISKKDKDPVEII